MKNKKLILGLLFFISFIFLFKTAHEEISKGSSKFEETFSLKKFLPVGLKEALKNTVFVHSQLNATKKNNEELKILGTTVTSIGPRYQDFTDDEIANSNCVKLNESPIIIVNWFDFNKPRPIIKLHRMSKL